MQTEVQQVKVIFDLAVQRGCGLSFSGDIHPMKPVASGFPHRPNTGLLPYHVLISMT